MRKALIYKKKTRPPYLRCSEQQQCWCYACQRRRPFAGCGWILRPPERRLLSGEESTMNSKSRTPSHSTSPPCTTLQSGEFCRKSWSDGNTVFFLAKTMTRHDMILRIICFQNGASTTVFIVEINQFKFPSCKQQTGISQIHTSSRSASLYLEVGDSWCVELQTGLSLSAPVPVEALQDEVMDGQPLASCQLWCELEGVLLELV